jgi:hypothetical protein
MEIEGKFSICHLTYLKIDSLFHGVNYPMHIFCVNIYDETYIVTRASLLDYKGCNSCRHFARVSVYTSYS